MKRKICLSFPDWLKKSAVIGMCFALLLWGAAGTNVLAVDDAGEESGVVTTFITPIETDISNFTTSVPETVQTTNPPQAVTVPDTTLPYNEPVIHDEDDEVESILDLLDVNTNTSTIDIIILLTILSLAPSILIMMTCFTRIIIAFSLLRNAMGVQTTPPNQVMIGLALFLTLFIMSPVIDEMNEAAYVPYKNGEYTSIEAVQAASVPLKQWMLRNTSNETMAFFINLSGEDYSAETAEEFAEIIPFRLAAPAFMLSEIKIGFQIGFLLFIPFLVIDLVVSSVLMSMGMMMMPPSTVSMPFKILMFVLADGWQLLAGSLVSGFNL
ncbi:MAG: flagellar type III secretion system pore protein FliP [Ruminococcus sp.]|nr:flagellar type III secretion system pore protein FliP [Ruminococcus sp.]